MKRCVLAIALVLGACSTASVDGGSSGGSGAGTTTGGSAGSGGRGSGSGSGSGSSSAATSGSGTSGGSSTGGAADDTFLPWEGGPAYYGSWTHAPSTDAAFFPIAVWLQSASNAPAYADIGINTFIGLYDGPTNQQLSDQAAANMPVICGQDVDWQSHLADPIILGWQQEDEPDNAQSDGNGGYGPCVDPTVIQQIGATFKTNDPSRPVYLNLGQGTAWAGYYGRGSACAGVDDYDQYALGADILSFDIYPVNSTDAPVAGKLELVAAGVEHLRTASNDQKPVWTWIETTGINDPTLTPSPDQIRTEVWMALVHGARGFGYFSHIFSPGFIEAGLLSVATSKQAVHDIDAQVLSLAPVLNTQSLANGASVQSSDANVPIDVMVKRTSSLYVFAVAMRNSPATGTFTVRTPQTGTVTVLGESRTIPLVAGSFTDAFTGYAVHLYQIDP